MTLSRRAAIRIGVGAAGAAMLGGVSSRQRRPDREPSSPPVSDADGHLPWRNWSGVASSYPKARAAPESESAIADLVTRTPAPIRPVSAGHSFNALVPIFGTLVPLDGLRGVLAHDAISHQATVWAGRRLGISVRRWLRLTKRRSAFLTSTSSRLAAQSVPARRARALNTRRSMVACNPSAASRRAARSSIAARIEIQMSPAAETTRRRAPTARRCSAHFATASRRAHDVRAPPSAARG